jgi:hypothetical protein
VSQATKTTPKKIKVYMGIPSTGDRVDAQNYFLRRCEKAYGDRIEFVYPEVFVGRIFHDYARNKYVEQFLASDCDVLWFLDSDIIPKENLLNLVTDHWDEWKLAGAPYPVWMTQNGYETPQITYCVYNEIEGKPGHLGPAAVPETGTDFVHGIATGCIFIKREVLEKLSKPYFEFKYKADDREMTEGEDLGFCKKVNALGYKFFIDYSMVCHHFKKISLLDVNNYALVQVSQAVDAYDKNIRNILTRKRMEKELQPTKSKSRLILP